MVPESDQLNGSNPKSVPAYRPMHSVSWVAECNGDDALIDIADDEKGAYAD
jgi:hypothetical protein